MSMLTIMVGVTQTVFQLPLSKPYVEIKVVSSELKRGSVDSGLCS